MAIAAGPGRMRLGVNVEGESVALLAIGGVGLKLSAVRHHHLDAVIVWVEVLKLLHGCLTGWLSHKTSYAAARKVPGAKGKAAARGGPAPWRPVVPNPAPHTARLVPRQARRSPSALDLRSRLE